MTLLHIEGRDGRSIIVLKIQAPHKDRFAAGFRGGTLLFDHGSEQHGRAQPYDVQRWLNINTVDRWIGIFFFAAYHNNP